MINVIAQSLGLDLVNIDVYAKVYQNISSKRFISLFDRGQNVLKLSGDKIKCLIIGHALKVNLQLSIDFLRFVQFEAFFFFFFFSGKTRHWR